jgi:DNA-binding LacI/PurR family transcriptional regulator
VTRPGQARPAANIQDVARAAGVGRQTVSNVLNGGGRVGEAARARVLEAVTALGYQPHHGARSLRSRRTRQLAYVMPRIQLQPDNYIMQQFLQALAAASARLGHSVMVAVPDGDPRDEIRRLIASRTVDAFLLSELQPLDPRVMLLAEARMPFACFGRIGPGLPQHWVDIDNHAAIIGAVEHVLARGFSRTAFVGYRSAEHWDLGRVSGYKAALARHGVPGDQADVLLVGEADARREIRSLLTGAARAGRPGGRTAVTPDAIVTGSDRLAAVVYGVAAELRMRIGRDLAVTGFDGSAAGGLLHPPLTSVAIPVEEIARRVIARVLRQLDHGPDEAPGEVVPATLRVGESTGGLQGFRPGGPAGSAGTEPELFRKRFQGTGGPAGRRVTIADVAADAGVGVGTVSRVLNGGDQVRAATRLAVQDSIDRLRYRPSHAAAALVRGTPRTVAVLVAHMTRPSTVVRVASALAVLADEGYDTIIRNVDTPAERDRHLETLLPTHRADGVLAISLPLSREQLAQFGRAGVTLVSVDAVTPGVPQTIIDDAAGGRLATGHLIALGHRRIGFVGDVPSARPPAGLGFTSSANRLRGYRQALAAAGISVRPDLIRRGPHDAATAAEHAAQLLKAHDPPTAIFAASDTQAIGVLAAAERLGVAVPGQLSVVGFDDIESAAFLGLSTVRQPLARSGAEGAQRLCALLRGERLRARRVELPLELVARDSTAPASGVQA